MRLLDIGLIITCVPEEGRGLEEVYCDKVGNCDGCLKATFVTLEKKSKGAQNFKVEKFNIEKIIDLKKR